MEVKELLNSMTYTVHNYVIHNAVSKSRIISGNVLKSVLRKLGVFRLKPGNAKSFINNSYLSGNMF